MWLRRRRGSGIRTMSSSRHRVGPNQGYHGSILGGEVGLHCPADILGPYLCEALPEAERGPPIPMGGCGSGQLERQTEVRHEASDLPRLDLVSDALELRFRGGRMSQGIELRVNGLFDLTRRVWKAGGGVNREPAGESEPQGP